MDDKQPQLAIDDYVAAMRQRMEQTLREVAEAVNQAPDGQWIEGSEEQVRDAFAQLRQAAYEEALQRRIDAAEAAFSPSGR